MDAERHKTIQDWEDIIRTILISKQSSEHEYDNGKDGPLLPTLNNTFMVVRRPHEKGSHVTSHTMEGESSGHAETGLCRYHDSV